MEMEFDLHPDDAAKLPRLKVLASAPASRVRPQPFRAVWHDSPGRALAGQGLSLAHLRTGWLLERLVPGEGDWLPGQPAPRIESAERQEELRHPLPSPLPPAAAIDGRQVTYSLEHDGSPVTLTQIRGVLRAVEAERPVCRLQIHGADDAVRSLALGLADTVRLALPRASLAAEALAMAQGVAPDARRLGAPSLPRGSDHGQSLPTAFSHAIGHLTDVMLYHAPYAADPASGPEPVHQMRVAVRRARSVIAVFRNVLGCPAVDRANQLLKALGGRLGPARDWDVFVTETAPAIVAAVQPNSRLDRLLAASERRRKECHTALEAYLECQDFRVTCIELAWLASAVSWHGTLEAQAPLAMELEAFAASVLQQRWKKLLAGGKDIEKLDTPALHGLRLRAKRLRYAAELFASLYTGKATGRFIRRLSQLQQALGVLNDSAVAAQLLDELGGPGGRHAYAIGVVQGFNAAAVTTIHPAIFRSWDKFRSQSAFWS